MALSGMVNAVTGMLKSTNIDDRNGVDAWTSSEKETPRSRGSTIVPDKDNEDNTNGNNGDEFGSNDFTSGDNTTEKRAAPREKTPEEIAEMRERAREHKWTEPQKYNYDEALLGSGESSLPWFAKAARYEWSDEYGDVAPRIPELEDQLFKDSYITTQGTHMDEYTKFTVAVSGPNEIAPAREFEDAGIHPLIMENMKLCGYARPTPIQSYGIPAALQGHDVAAIAQAGSGKTGAYLIPVLSKLAGKILKVGAKRPGIGLPLGTAVRAEPLVLIIAPTRELVVQIFDHARRLCYRTMLRPCVAYGGGPVKGQIEELQKGCDVLIATLGRLGDLLGRENVVALNRVRYIIYDEADEMLQDDWSSELEAILAAQRGRIAVQTLMYSATFGEAAREAAAKYTKPSVVRIEVGRVGSTHGNITQTFKEVSQENKKEALYDLLFFLPPARTLIFVNHKETADDVDDFLYNRALPTASIHAGKYQRERETALNGFRDGTSPILITTAIAARGIDVKDVHHVVNFDLPSTTHGGIEEYVHRIGRTGRIGNEGLSTSFFNEKNSDIGPELIKLLIESGQPVPRFMAEHLGSQYEVEWADEEEQKVIAYVATPELAPMDESNGFGDNGFGNDDGFGENNEFNATNGDVEALILDD